MDQPAPVTSLPADLASKVVQSLQTLPRFWQKRPPALLPPAASAPSVLLWVWLLPQALLLFLNFQAWDLASGEMNADQRSVALGLFVGELLLLLGGGAFLAERVVRRRPIPRLAGLTLVLAASVYLAFVFLDGGNAIPASLSEWMLPPNQWVYKQFALVGPGALYGAFRLLCPDREGNIIGGLVLSLLALAAPFGLLLLLIGGGISSGLLGLDSKVASHLFVPLYLAASTLAIGAVLRLSVSAYVAARRWSPTALSVLTGIVALVLPLAGLALNSRIPFPVDFQIPTIYALVAINGIILALPYFASPLAQRLVWLAQCALFPFTAYFFFTFLPFLALMPLAAICMGLGLLMCVPSALFLLHGYRILNGARIERRDGPRWRPALLATVAIAIGPVLLTAKILHDRASLRQALDYLQYPDYAGATTFRGDRTALRATLLNLRDFKAGHYLPFYSEFYNWLAFDNLVLPEAKLNETYRAFFGEPMPASTSQQMDAPFFSLNRPRNVQEMLSGVEGERPRADATLAALQTTFAPQPGEIHVTARMTLHNATDAPTEYRTAIHVPAGVVVSGLWLTIGDKRVPARLFEERAALWVYQKITEVRPVPRDPAILHYTAPETAELRVFPVEKNADRSVEIEFTYPENFVPSITLDNHQLALPPAASSTITLAPGAAWIPATIAADVPSINRQPEPHLIIDISRDSRFRDPAALGAAIRQTLDSFPAARTARVTFANFDVRPFHNGDSIPVQTLRTLAPATLLAAAGPFAGGFLETRAIKTTLVRSLARPTEDFVHNFPALVVLRGANDSTVRIGAESLADFAQLLPDQSAIWQWNAQASAPELHPLDPLDPPATSPRPVHLYERDGQRFAEIAGHPTFLLGNTTTNGPVKIYDPRVRAFRPLEATTAATPTLTADAAAWTVANERLFAPATAGPNSLTILLDRARAARVLVPATALMVVENSAQWKMLTRTEKKTLKGHEALALSETAATPEPGTITLLVLAGLCALAWKARRRFGVATR